MQGRNQLIDVWRGISCLLVVIFHASEIFIDTPEVQSMLPSFLLEILDLSDIGVICFFSISGYCIMASASKYTPGIFIKNRIKRIFPAYIAALSLFLVFNSLPSSYNNLDIISNFLLTAPITFYLFDGSLQPIMRQAWSLFYELQFYLVVGMIMILRLNLYALLAILTCFSFANTIVHLFTGSPFAAALFIDSNWLYFASGLFTYKLINGNVKKRKIAAYLAPIITLLSLLVGVHLNFDPFLYFAISLLPMITLLFQSERSAIRKKNILQEMFAKLGKISYSVYLTHIIFTDFFGEKLLAYSVTTPALALLAAIGLSIICTILFSIIFYNLFERPLIRTQLNYFLKLPRCIKFLYLRTSHDKITSL